MTCYGDPGYSYRITNSAGDTMVRDTYTKLHNDYAVSKFTVPEAGYYYVELNGSKSSEQKYVFMIGSPTYVFAVQNISCVEGSVSMTSGGRKQTVLMEARCRDSRRMLLPVPLQWTEFL